MYRHNSGRGDKDEALEGTISKIRKPEMQRTLDTKNERKKNEKKEYSKDSQGNILPP